MLMLDVRNAIANILDRYTLENIVEVALRKMRRDNVNLPFLVSPRAKGEAKTKRAALEKSPSELGLGEFLYREGI